jgi:transposase
MTDAKRFVGIDGANAQLDVAIWPNRESLSVVNDETGISKLARRLEPAELVIIETTGGLEVPVASALATAGIAVAAVNRVKPVRRLRHHRRSGRAP